MSALLASWGALEADERKARCRTLAAMVYVFAGPSPQVKDIIRLLRAAEDDPAMLEYADHQLGALPARPHRRALAVLGQFCHAGGA